MEFRKSAFDSRRQIPESTASLGIMKKMLLCLALFALPACSTLKDRAQEHLENGEVEQALSLIDRHAQDYPSDSEGSSLQKRVRQKWLENKLIQVRLQRLGGNLGESESTLRQVIARQNEWNIFPSGVVFVTQNEEIIELSKRIKSDLETSIQQKTPIKAQWLLEKNRTLLQDTLKNDVSLLEKQITILGLEFCKNEAKTIGQKDFYSYRFLTQICGSWKHQVQKKSVQNSVQLYSGAAITARVQGLPDRSNPKVIAELDQAFAKSFWVDKSSKLTLPIEISGSLKSEINSLTRELSASYTVQVPYTHTERRTRSESSVQNRGLAFAVLDLLVGSNENVSDNGDGTETVKTTRYRSEYRQHYYTSTQYIQKLSVDLSLVGLLNGKKFATSYSSIFSNKSEEHNENFPQAGVHPEKQVVISELQHLETETGRIVETFSNFLSEQWIEQFCLDKTIEENKSLASRQEIAHRCLFGAKQKTPGHHDVWFQEKYGLDVEKLIELSKSKGFSI